MPQLFYLAKEIMFLPLFVCPSVHTAWISIIFLDNVGPRNGLFNFGGDLEHCLSCGSDFTEICVFQVLFLFCIVIWLTAEVKIKIYRMKWVEIVQNSSRSLFYKWSIFKTSCILFALSLNGLYWYCCELQTLPVILSLNTTSCGAETIQLVSSSMS